MIGWILTGLSITGALLNSRKRVEGFYFWMVGNIGWTILTICKEMYSQTALWLFYCGICAYGIYHWTKEKKGKA